MLLYQPHGQTSALSLVYALRTDSESAIGSIGFPTVFGSDSSTQTTGPYSQTYSWTASASASGEKTVTATNNAGSPNTSTVTVTPDHAAPTGESVALSCRPNYANP